MVREIAAANPRALKGAEIVGPLVLNGQLVTGNAIGIWKQPS
jgi:hypothetical protein